MSGFGFSSWSGEQQLFWQAAATGETLELALPAQPPGRYRLVAHYTRAPDYGIVQASVNGTDAGGPTDLYAHNVRVSDPLDLGVITVAEGEPLVFKMTIVAKNPSSKGYFVGLDYLKLIRVP
jgi:hypothetical protein